MKKVPNLRFKEFKGEWEQHVLGDIFEFYTTNSFSRDFLDNDNGSVKNIHYGDIHMKFPTLLNIKNTQIPYVKESVDLSKISLDSYCKNGDVVIADASEDYNDIGKAIELKSIGEEKIIAGLHTILARDNKGIMVNGFRGYLMTSPNVRKQIKVYAAGAKVLGISKANISKVKLLIPSGMEQEKIAAFFYLIDKKIELQTEKVEELKNYKKGLMQKMFPRNGETVPKLRFAGFTNDWEKRKLEDEFYKVNERNDGSFGKEHWISVAKMYFQDPEKVQSNNIDTRTYVMRYGDIAFEGNKSKSFKYGRFVVNDIGDGVVSELFPIYRHKKSYSNDFWKRAIQIDSIMAPIFSKCITSSGVSSNKLDDKHFLRQSIFVPDIEEQHKIGDYFKTLDKLITLQQRKLDALNEYKKGLLQQMFI